MIGTVLGNRYRLDQLIGEGGMALVYRAECSLLQRPVAVKILRPQFAADAEFVERFRREAQAAARLSHPNIVNVYDVGQDQGLNYMVMEYVPGENLKDLIKREGPFTITRALNIARQICEALHHAHQNNIIHRDIKPHNILITPDGRVKVTDFGIARAVSASTLTQSGSVLGSVQYFSPEQAKGQPAGVASDLYSLGCVLYEMLTGSVPFKGESPIAIALKHLQEQPPPLRSLRPGVPPAVERLVARALAKDPAVRFPSALAMLREIQSILGQSGLEVSDDQDTEPITQVMPALPDQTGDKRYFLKVFFGIFAAIVLATIIFFWYMLYYTVPKEIKVPNLVGMTLPDAQAAAKGFKLEVEYRSDDKTPEDTVMRQEPEAGITVRARDLKVVVSSGPEKATVPDLHGLDPTNAQLKLEALDLTYAETPEGVTSSSVQAGLVAEQSPDAGLEVARGSTVTVSLSLGNNFVLKQDFRGQPFADVQQILDGLGLSYYPDYVSSGEPAGTVVGQDPLPGKTVPVGTVVVLEVSNGQPNVDIP